MRVFRPKVKKKKSGGGNVNWWNELKDLSRASGYPTNLLKDLKEGELQNLSHKYRKRKFKSKKPDRPHELNFHRNIRKFYKPPSYY